ncbi:MAG: tetratricopeptide repeat protein [Polyangiaceae bacterium]
MIRFGLIAFLPLCSVMACAEGSGGVTRMADGVRYEGRFVNPEAYAAYLLGVEREARGQYASALSAYQEAHAEDPDSPEIWARIGAVRCASSAPEQGLSAARNAFQRGLENDPEYFGNYLERARCAERARDLKAALADASAAVARRPADEPANLLVARLLRALGRTTEARAWLEAFQSYQAASPGLSRALDASRHQASSPASRSPNSALEGPFDALRAGRLTRAREQAQTELDADPSNADAWIAALVACDALHDEACFERVLDSLKSPSLAPSPTALSYLRELLARRAGAQVVF